ncbi:hypothetical protein [Methylobacterium crusticola]|nr:hypothetical protein [Methylobacterium crusticola]
MILLYVAVLTALVVGVALLTSYVSNRYLHQSKADTSSAIFSR